MRTEDLAWDYNIYALDSILHNGCVIVSIAAGCGCYVLVKQRAFVKWGAMALVMAAGSGVHFMAYRNSGFETFVARDLVTVFASGFVISLLVDVFRRRKRSSQAGKSTTVR